MPPPPTGMAVVQAEVPGVPPAEAAAPDSDEPPTSELEEMRALEDKAIEPAPKSDLALRLNLRHLGYGSAVRQHLECALDEADAFGEELPFELAPVTDLANFDVNSVKGRYDIPVEMQPLVVQYIHFFQGSGRKWFRRWMSRSSRYVPVMQPILESQGLPRDLVYLSMIESGFNTQAKSWAAAVGPWQFIAGTARDYNLRNDFWVDERRDFVKSTWAAGRFLGHLHRDLGHWYLAWAGYNTGGNRVRRMIAAQKTTDFWQLSESKRGFAKETKHYVPKLIACALVAKHPEAFGFSQDEFQYEAPLEFDEVKLTSQVDLDVLARAANITLEELALYNPELKRWCTPPATETEPYLVRIPKVSAALFAENFAKFTPGERLNFVFHKVKKGDTLSAIARTWHSAPEAILKMNGLKSAKSLRVNSELIIPTPSARALKSGKADPSFERQVAHARKTIAAVRPEDEVPAGAGTARSVAQGTVAIEKVGAKTRVAYGVASGDTLWSISQRFDCSITDLKNWNEVLERGAKRMRVGTSLIIWPGPKARLEVATAKP
ncbi:MAG: Membrane-bound lytic murein transglycosylase precursor [Myxococcaceae bacterium]|nr:Membrane-bound lytic murein transglycosylase precursor [Myxococcaceae bacterium]